MTTLSTVRTRRHRLLVGGQWIDPAGLVGRRHIFEGMTQVRSVAFDVGGGPG